MFEGMKAKSLDISKADYQELKKWQGHRQENVKLIFQTVSYQRLSLEYKNRVYQTLNQLQDRELDLLEDDVLINF